MRYPRFLKTHSWLSALILIGGVALLLRVIYLLELRGTPFFSVLIGDGQQYDLWAQQIAGGQWIGTEVFYQTPLCPYFLAVIFKLAGHDLFAVRLIEAILGSVSCVLLGFACRRFFSRRVGLIAAGLLAVYPPAIFFDGLIQKSSLDLFFMALTLFVIGEFQQRRSCKWLVVAGLVIGLLTLNRENARILFPLIVIWLLFAFRDTSLKTRFVWSAILTSAMLLVLLPVGFRNYYVAGDFLISTSQLGPNLYIGNHEGAQGSYEPLIPGRGNASFERIDATRLAEEALNRKLSPAEVSSYWTNRSLQYMRSKPFAWLSLMGWKALLTFSAREIVDTESIEVYSEYSRLLWLLSWLSFGLILPFGVFGIWCTRSQWRRIWLLYAMLFGLVLAVAIFYVVARYRFPIVPIVILFAAAGLAAIPSMKPAEWRRWVPGALLAIVVTIPAFLVVGFGNDETLLNVGQELIKQNRPAEAVPLLEKAISASPNYAPLHFQLGVALNSSGNKDLALDAFDAAIKYQPDYFEAHSAMALTLREKGLAVNALQHFREAVRLRPSSVEARNNLGSALAESGKADEAVAEYEAALKIEPDNPTTHSGLALVLHQQKKLDEAIRHYNLALKVEPEDAGVHSNLALALKAIGNSAAATEHFSEAIRLQPDNIGIQINFADFLSSEGKTAESITHYVQAVRLAPEFMETNYRLAAAYFRAGHVNEATETLEKALSIAQQTGQTDEVPQLMALLNEYREYRSGSKSGK
jgi:tetratricopeptide (TPR) repeat protein